MYQLHQHIIVPYLSIPLDIALITCVFYIKTKFTIQGALYRANQLKARRRRTQNGLSGESTVTWYSVSIFPTVRSEIVIYLTTLLFPILCCIVFIMSSLLLSL